MSDLSNVQDRRPVEVEGSLNIEGDGISAKVSGSKNLIFLELPTLGSLWKLRAFAHFWHWVKAHSRSGDRPIPLVAELRIRERTLARASLHTHGIVARLTPVQFLTGKH